jgi:outer membrane lipoprotein-sorting protein
MVRKSLAWLVLGGLIAVAASAQTADEVIEKYISAKGGREKLKAVQSVRMTGKMDIGNGAQAPFIMEMKRPHKVRTEFTIQGMTGTQAYDGTTGWMVMPFMGKKDPEVMAADDLKDIDDQADFEGALVDYKAKGHQVELLGKQTIEGTPAWKLKLTKKNGDVAYVYLDADAYLEVKEEGKRNVRGQEVEFESTMGDYKTVDGIVFPFSLQAKPKGAPAGMTITVEKVEINPAVDDARFVMPKVEKKEGAPKPQ